MPKHRDDQERFWEKVIRTDYCWLWIAYTNPAGYGRFGLWATNRTMVLAHRFAWETANGPVPDGMHVLHHCDNPACVRVTHLFLGTDADNIADKMAKGRQSMGLHLRKVTDAQVLAIRADTRSQTEIAADYGITQSQISRIKTGKQRGYTSFRCSSPDR